MPCLPCRTQILRPDHSPAAWLFFVIVDDGAQRSAPTRTGHRHGGNGRCRRPIRFRGLPGRRTDLIAGGYARRVNSLSAWQAHQDSSRLCRPWSDEFACCSMRGLRFSLVFAGLAAHLRRGSFGKQRVAWAAAGASKTARHFRRIRPTAATLLSLTLGIWHLFTNHVRFHFKRHGPPDCKGHHILTAMFDGGALFAGSCVLTWVWQ